VWAGCGSITSQDKQKPEKLKPVDFMVDVQHLTARAGVSIK